MRQSHKSSSTILIFAYIINILAIYSACLSAEAEGTIVAAKPFISSFDHGSYPWIVLLVAPAILIVSLTVLWLLFKSNPKKGTELAL
jgi:uncharacterized BrkB/YihY/UPF0761 family membrane protein